MTSGPGAVQWLDSTFKSQERTAELLRPDLESGLITQRDYNTAVVFLPGPHRYYPIIYSATSTALFFAIARTRRWSLTAPRNFAFGFGANFLGLLVGQFQRARGHLQFASQLDDPTGFSQALQNVNVRTGGKEPLRWVLPGTDVERLKHGLLGSHSTNEDSNRPPEEGWIQEPQMTADIPPSGLATSSTSPSTSSTNVSPSTSTRSPSKWDEIRAANARAAAQSSAWDALRQQHERERILERQQQQQQQRDPDSSSSRVGSPGDDYFAQPPSSRYSEDDRAQEQARFNAMLDAERRMSRE